MKTPGWGSQSSLSQGPRGVGGGAWAGPPDLYHLISAFLQPTPWAAAAELGTPAEQSPGLSVTCVGSGAPSGWGLGERVQLACCLAIPLWEMGQVVASAGRLAHPDKAQSPPEEGCWVMRLELRDPRVQRGSRER